MRSYPSATEAPGQRFAIVVARFNHLVTVRLLEGCTAELERRGVAPDDVHVAWVPGAFEIPTACRALAETGRYAAVVTLGAVIRGGTPHFDYVCRAVTDGVREAARDTGVPVAFGVLTTDDIDQALERVGGSDGHKGEEAAAVAVEMARLVPALKTPPPEDGGSGAGDGGS
jgi:6,7-dimethyl-8-ribityllumazine synthase